MAPPSLSREQLRALKESLADVDDPAAAADSLKDVLGSWIAQQAKQEHVSKARLRQATSERRRSLEDALQGSNADDLGDQVRNSDDIKQRLKQRYGANGEGVFTEEQIDRMMDEFLQEVGKNDNLVESNSFLVDKINGMSRIMKIVVGLSACMTIAFGISTFYAVTAGNNELEQTISRSVDGSILTSVSTDQDGSVHLQSREGNDLSMRGFGDAFVSTPVRERGTGRTLHCVSLASVAAMANDVAAGVTTSLELLDEAGVARDIVPLGGSFHDGEWVLTFADGLLQVRLDSDACEETIAAAVDPHNEDGLEENAPGEDDAEDGPERRLRGPGAAETAAGTVTALARRRAEYLTLRTALREGRALVSSTSVMVIYMYSGENLGCPDSFVLNPTDLELDIDKDGGWAGRDTFLDQFKPCGYYHAHCQHKFKVWFDPLELEDLPIEANVDYPGNGKDGDLETKVYLVRFDIGLDTATKQGYNELAEEYGPLIDDADDEVSRLHKETNLERHYLDIMKDKESGGFKWNSIIQTGPPSGGEQCLETFAVAFDDWSTIPGGLVGAEHKASYDGMGRCGPGEKSFGAAKDCMKHDVCSYFKGLVLNMDSNGFCLDFDCGDEAAQTVFNCFLGEASEPQCFIPDGWTDWTDRIEDSKWLNWMLPGDGVCDNMSVCSAELETTPGFYGALSIAVNYPLKQKRECTLRTGWERNQGMPSERHGDGEPCVSDDDCQSRRCDNISYFSGLRICQARLANGERCNEDNDCVSLDCGGRIWNKKCRQG